METIRNEKKKVENKAFIEGVTKLIVTKNITTLEFIRKITPTGKLGKVINKKEMNKEVETKCFHLKEITKEEIEIYRKSQIPSFLLKMEGKFYYTKIEPDISLVASKVLGTHQCTKLGRECRRFSAASDEKGGCAKVREYSQKIEKYPWIITGYETFNTNHDSFVVVKCEHYEGV